jgi:hypothetical protein
MFKEKYYEEVFNYCDFGAAGCDPVISAGEWICPLRP